MENVSDVPGSFVEGSCGDSIDTTASQIVCIRAGDWGEGNQNAKANGIVGRLKQERNLVEKHLSALNAALRAVIDVYSGSKSKGTRTMSAAARRKISLAQKARWAKQKTANGKASPAKPQRTMSAAARKKIAAAQRARWAKVRAGEKAA